MNIHSRKYILVSLFFICTFFLSCNQTAPSIYNCEFYVVHSYTKEKSLPESKISFFIESASDVRRVENIQINLPSENLSWNIDDVMMFKSQDKQYAGYTNLNMPAGERFPQGKYDIVYENADGQTANLSYLFAYDDSLYAFKTEDAELRMKNKDALHNIAIFDNENKLIFYGEFNEELDSPRKIWNKYNKAAFYRDVYLMQNTICLFPFKEVKTENN